MGASPEIGIIVFGDIASCVQGLSDAEVLGQEIAKLGADIDMSPLTALHCTPEDAALQAAKYGP